MNRQQEYKDMLHELESIPNEMMQMSAKTKPRARKRALIRYAATPPGIFVALILMLAIGVNISPTMVNALERIPVIRQIAAAVNFSPSLTDAIENEFIQRIGQQQTINNITMRVEYVIVDQRQLNIFYTIESPDYSHINSWVSVLCTDENHHLPVSIFEMGHGDHFNETGSLRQAVVNFVDMQMPSHLIFEARITTYNAPYAEEVVPIPAQPAPAQSQAQYENREHECEDPSSHQYTIFKFNLEFDPTFTEQGEIILVNHNFVIDGQSLQLTTVEIYPTHMRVNFTACANNTAWLRSMQFYVLKVDGSRFDAISSGITAFGAYDSPMMASHILHSPFFAESNHLTLLIEEVIWLDKDMERVRIDLPRGTAERLPEGVTLYETRQEGNSWHLSFAAVERVPFHVHQVFGSRYFDEAGNEFWFTSWTSGMRRIGLDGAFTPGVFYEEFTIHDYLYDVVYLMPNFSRIVRPDEPIVIGI